jgi:hypothetical protein
MLAVALILRAPMDYVPSALQVERKTAEILSLRSELQKQRQPIQCHPPADSGVQPLPRPPQRPLCESNNRRPQQMGIGCKRPRDELDRDAPAAGVTAQAAFQGDSSRRDRDSNRGERPLQYSTSIAGTNDRYYQQRPALKVGAQWESKIHQHEYSTGHRNISRGGSGNGCGRHGDERDHQRPASDPGNHNVKTTSSRHG